MQRIIKAGYTCELHKATTNDGYILSLQRILPRNHLKSKGVVFIMHGLLMNSEFYVFTGKNRALPYLLADHGYDVWLGNDRGSYYFVDHKIYDKNSKEFWNFGLDEIGLYDYKSMIDYILATTKQASLNYIGHSQGGCGLSILLSSFPSYNKKIRQAQLFSPAPFVANSFTLKNTLVEYVVK